MTKYTDLEKRVENLEHVAFPSVPAYDTVKRLEKRVAALEEKQAALADDCLRPEVQPTPSPDAMRRAREVPVYLNPKETEFFARAIDQAVAEERDGESYVWDRYWIKKHRDLQARYYKLRDAALLVAYEDGCSRPPYSIRLGELTALRGVLEETEA